MYKRQVQNRLWDLTAIPVRYYFCGILQCSASVGLWDIWCSASRSRSHLHNPEISEHSCQWLCLLVRLLGIIRVAFQWTPQSYAFWEPEHWSRTMNASMRMIGRDYESKTVTALFSSVLVLLVYELRCANIRMVVPTLMPVLIPQLQRHGWRETLYSPSTPKNHRVYCIIFFFQIMWLSSRKEPGLENFQNIHLVFLFKMM